MPAATTLQLLEWTKDLLTTAGYTAIVLRAFPAAREWDNVPDSGLVVISPAMRSRVEVVAFGDGSNQPGIVEQDNELELVIIQKNEGDLVTPLGGTFLADAITGLLTNSFRGFPTNLPPGCWNIKVTDPQEFYRPYLVKNLVYTSLRATFTVV